MKRKLVLLAAAGAAVWALALLDFGARKPPVTAQQEPEVAAAQQPFVAAARPAAPRAQPDEPAQEPSASEPPETPARASSPASGVLRAAQGTVAVIGKAARALLGRGRSQTAAPADAPPAQPRQMPATGEIGQGASTPAYVDAERKFVGEARDGAWASAQEQRVRALLAPQTWSDRVSLVNCQQSTCRILIETDAAQPFHQLLGVPGLSDATGIASGTPYSLRNGQLSVYFTPSSLPSLPGAEHASN